MIKKLLLRTTLFALPLVGGVYGAEEPEEKRAPNKTIFNLLSEEVFDEIHQYLNPQDSGRLQQASRELNDLVHSARIRSIDTVMSHLNCVNPSPSNTRVEEGLNQLFYNRSLHPLLLDKLINKFEEGYFLFAPHESPLQWFLVDVLGFRRISLRKGLEDPKRATALYKALFGGDLPEGDIRDGALDHLAACLPVHEIYVDENSAYTDEARKYIFDEFFETNGAGLNAKLKNMVTVQRYFSFGVTENDDALKGDIHYNIVVNQRQLPLLRRLELPENHPHRIILKIQEARDGVLSLNTNQLPLNVGKLCIVDNDHLSRSIGDYFLYICRSLTSLDTSGLQNVKSISDDFLRGCSSLTSLDTRGLQNVEFIGEGFLVGCPKLDIDPEKLRAEILERGKAKVAQKKSES